jgi:hypothetical protein
VTASTKETIASLPGPSFQDGSGSLIAIAALTEKQTKRHSQIAILKLFT